MTHIIRKSPSETPCELEIRREHIGKLAKFKDGSAHLILGWAEGKKYPVCTFLGFYSTNGKHYKQTKEEQDIIKIMEF